MFEISNFSVSYKNKKILRNISLNLEPGKLIVLMGPNGSGKSSLASSIMGHPNFTIDNGTCNFNGENILNLSIENRARRGIFLASQNSISIPGVQVSTFLREAYHMLKPDNQNISLENFKEKLGHALDMVGLDHKFLLRTLNEGFSGGEKKRFEIAQLILFEPKIAILDEIDSGLDSDALKLLANALAYSKNLNPNLSILLITHYNRLLNYLTPDKIHVLYKGQIIKSGNMEIAKEIESNGYDKFIQN